MCDTLIGYPVTHVPIVISKPGIYRLANDLALTTPPPGNSSGSIAITISSNDVILDFDGHSLTASGAANTHNSAAVAINSDHVTVRNGTIIGFGAAIGGGGNATTIEHLTCQSQIGQYAIGGLGQDSLVEGCRVTNPSLGVSTGIGIFLAGSGVIEDCTVSDLRPATPAAAYVFVTNFAQGIPPSTTEFTGIVRHCVVSNLPAGATNSTGVTSSADNTVVDDCSFYSIGTPFQPLGGCEFIVKQSTFRACGNSFTGTAITDGGGNALVQ